MAAFELTLSSAMKPFRSCLPHLLLAIALAVPTAAAAQRLDPVYIEDRLNQLQQSLTMLTGQLEQLQYRNQQLQQQMEKMQADYEYRLEQMEKGGGRPGGPPPRPNMQAAAPPPPPSAPPSTAAPSAASALTGPARTSIRGSSVNDGSQLAGAGARRRAARPCPPRRRPSSR